jgi:hypothetical protein
MVYACGDSYSGNRKIVYFMEKVCKYSPTYKNPIRKKKYLGVYKQRIKNGKGRYNNADKKVFENI